MENRTLKVGLIRIVNSVTIKLIFATVCIGISDVACSHLISRVFDFAIFKGKVQLTCSKFRDFSILLYVMH